MPVSYQFLRIADGQPENLDTVDREMCLATGETPNEKTYCGFFQLMQIVGMNIATRSDGFTTSKEGFEKYKAEVPDHFDEDEWALIERFTVTDYNYTCWR